MTDYAQEFVNFLNASPSPYHVVHNIKSKLVAAGYKEILERQAWEGQVSKGGKYFVTRNNSSIVAFGMGSKWKPGNSYSIVGAHTDSPVLRIKPVSKRNSEGYIQVGIELYGGGIWHSWFDSDLSLAGRVMVREGDKINSKLVDIKRPLLKIPTLAIHLDRDVNTKFEFNKETQMLPIAGLEQKAATKGGCCESEPLSEHQFQSVKSVVERHSTELLDLIAKEIDVNVLSIEDFELILYDHKPATLGGLNNEFVFSGRLDNQTSCFTGTTGLILGTEDLSEETGIRVFAAFDHEEIGSVSAQGAESNFLPNVLERLSFLYGDEKDVEKPLVRSSLPESSAKSFFLSSDVSHGVHPNYAGKYEVNHKPMLGNGPVIKINANQRYMTNSKGVIILKEIANAAKIPLQLFVVQNASPCGSTIGPALAAKTGIVTLDLGNPVLSMHSIRETGGAGDIEKQIMLFKGFWETYSDLEGKVNV